MLYKERGGTKKRKKDITKEERKNVRTRQGEQKRETKIQQKDIEGKGK